MDGTGTSEALWRARAEKALKGEPFESLVSRTLDGIEIRPLYPRGPGDALSVRQRPDRPWAIVQRVDHPDPAEANELALADLVGGANGLALVFEGAPSAYGFGIAPGDLGRTLEGVELDLVVLRLDPARDREDEAIAAVSDRISAARLVPQTLDVDFGLDPIGLGLGSDGVRDDWAERTLGRIRALRGAGFASPLLRADGRVHHDAGAGEVQELAAVLSTATAYLRCLEGEGIGLDEARRLISFELAVDADQFLGMSKLRALRRLWARVETACGLEPVPARIAAQTSFRMVSKLDPAVNWLRATCALFAAGTGGADQVTVLPHTIAFGLPDAFSRRMARNEQIVLIEESHLSKVSDPAAGSGAIEAMTGALARSAWDLFRRIEGEGGLIAMGRTGRWQALVEETAKERARRIETGEAPLVGTSIFRSEGQGGAETLPVPPKRDGERLLPVRRDAARFEEAGR